MSPGTIDSLAREGPADFDGVSKLNVPAPEWQGEGIRERGLAARAEERAKGL